MPCNTSRARWECHAIHHKGSVGMTCNTSKGLNGDAMQYIQGQKGCHAIHPGPKGMPCNTSRAQWECHAIHPGLKGMPCNTSRAQWECHAIHHKGSVGMTCNTPKGVNGDAMQYIQGQKGCHAIHLGLNGNAMQYIQGSMGMPCNTS